METAVNETVTISYTRFRWLVNACLTGICGLGVDDLPDFDLWNYYTENEFMTKQEWEKLANEAAKDWLAEEGFPFDGDDF